MRKLQAHFLAFFFHLQYSIMLTGIVMILIFKFAILDHIFLDYIKIEIEILLLFVQFTFVALYR